MTPPDFEVGAYYFPGFHPEPQLDRWHGKGWTEWELLRNAKPRFPGHRQPIVPREGELDESRPEVMRWKTDLAARAGLSHFIFDWYYYENGPFLNRCLDEGYLALDPAPKVKFALMWANHDWLNVQPARLDQKSPKLMDGAFGPKRFEEVCVHVIERYLSSPLYWKIDGKPYFSFYDLPNLIRGLGGSAGAAKALERFRQLAERAGLPGLHLNLVHWQTHLVGSVEEVVDPGRVIKDVGFDSLSSYVWIHHLPFDRFRFPQTPYNELLEFNERYWRETAAKFDIPYFPNVTMGWDASPRCRQSDPFENREYPFMATLSDNTPAHFRNALERAKRHVDGARLPARHFSINAWNEWTEGSYLEPDLVNGEAYLDALSAALRGTR